MAYKITDACIACGACADACPVGAPVQDLSNCIRKFGAVFAPCFLLWR